MAVVSLEESSVPGSPSDLNAGNGIEGAMVCTSLGSLLRPLFYFLCSNVKANPVVRSEIYLKQTHINMKNQVALGRDSMAAQII